MKSLLITVLILLAFALTPAFANAQTDEPIEGNYLFSQSLVREGTLATRLVEVLNLGTSMDEAEAESTLSSAGIAPRNGWIGDYPVTPDIIGELRNAISDAADSQAIAVSKDEALSSFQAVLDEYNLHIEADMREQAASEPSGTSYPDSTIINNYYDYDGPPVVTYYSPPPAYMYLYTWVPYPFWWWDVRFPGFFVLADFHFVKHGHGHGHRHGEFVSNHFRDHRTGRMFRIDPAHRFHGGTFADREISRWSSPSAQRGAAEIFNRSSAIGKSRGNFASSWSGRVGSPSSRSGASLLSSGRRGMMWGSPAGRRNDSPIFWRSSSGQPVYRTPSMWNRSTVSPSGGRSLIDSPSAGRGGSNTARGGWGSFGGGGRGAGGRGMGGMRR
jgi:hypothetical protein